VTAGEGAGEGVGGGTGSASAGTAHAAAASMAKNERVKKRTIALLIPRRKALTLGIALLLAACAGGAQHGNAGAAHVLRIADLSDPSSLDPLLAHDQDTIGYDLLVNQTLVAMDARNRLTPVLVERIPARANGGISGDGKTIVYHLRKGVRFADGVELTSADVAFTYRAIMDPRNPVLSQDAYRRIAAISTPDRYTVVIRLKHPWNAAVSDLFAQSDFAFGILPAHAFTSTALQHASWEQHPFGSGPFRIADWRRGDRVVLEPNPYFSPKPKLARIELRMIPDRGSAMVALQARDVDVAPILPQSIAQTESTPGLRVLRTPENATEWLTLQTQRGPAANVRVRRAIALALDLGALEKAYQSAYPEAAAFLPPVLPWHDHRIRAYPHDLRAARALLGKPIDALLVLAAGNAAWLRMATVIQQQLAPAGIRVTIKTFPTTLFNAPDGPVRNARFTIAIDGWLGGADPEQSIVFTCSQATVNGDNISRYCDPRFEALFADQQTARSPSRRMDDFLAMQRLVHDALPVIPVYYEVYFDGVNSRVRNFRRNMLRFPVAPESWDVNGE
jgi:peptide/nickel transport system substrate-binding protein